MSNWEEKCKFREATLEDHPNIVEFCNEHFVAYEPINKAIGLCDVGYRMPYFDKWIDDAVKSSGAIVLIAEDALSGDMLGVIINTLEPSAKGGDGAEDDLPRCRRMPEKFGRVMEFLSFLSEGIDISSSYQVDQWSDIMLLAARSDIRIPGLGTELVTRGMDLAQKRGIKVQTCIATSYFTARISEKLGFTTLKTLNFADYKRDGVVVFPPEEPHIQAKYFVKML